MGKIAGGNLRFLSRWKTRNTSSNTGGFSKAKRMSRQRWKSLKRLVILRQNENLSNYTCLSNQFLCSPYQFSGWLSKITVGTCILSFSFQRHVETDEVRLCFCGSYLKKKNRVIIVVSGCYGIWVKRTCFMWKFKGENSTNSWGKLQFIRNWN